MEIRYTLTPKQEIAMLNRQAAAIRRIREEMEEELAAIERLAIARARREALESGDKEIA